jgi:hypothetical protein
VCAYLAPLKLIAPTRRLVQTHNPGILASRPTAWVDMSYSSVVTQTHALSTPFDMRAAAYIFKGGL